MTPTGGERGQPRNLEREAPLNAYLYMDAGRFFLALAVAFGHLWALFIRDYEPTANPVVNGLYFAAGFAHSGVILFFVLSGYWITKSVVGRASAGWSWPSYLIDRVSRLLVVLIPALAVGGVLDAGALYVLESPTHLGATDTYVLKTDVAANLSPSVLLGNLLFLQSIVVVPFGSNGPLWSLAYEFWYYIWFPAAWLAFRARRATPVLLAFLLAILAPALAFGFISWLCGSVLFFAESKLRRSGTPLALRGMKSVVLAGVLLLVALMWGRTGDFSIEDPLLALSFSIFLLALLLTNPAPLRGISAFAAYGAGASFSLYAIHFPIMAFAAALFVGGMRLVPDLPTLALLTMVLLATLGLGWLFGQFTEARTTAVRSWARGRLRLA